MSDDRNRPVRASKAFLCHVANVIAGKLPDMGFALIVFPFGDEGGVSYLSNAEPAEIATQFRSMADRLEGADDVPSIGLRTVHRRLN